MNRNEFLQTMTATSLAAFELPDLHRATDAFPTTDKMPALFIGHGHPMNALLDNDFTQRLTQLGQQLERSGLERPSAVLVVSAHWETIGTYVSVNPAPKAIYDFGPFDDRLFQIKYEPVGSPALARTVREEVKLVDVQEDAQMGLDHGAWTILKYIFPKADVPVFQLSVNYAQKPEFHYQLGRELSRLRRKGVLIIGSGNIVHNLRALDWRHLEAKPHDWAVEFDAVVRQAIDGHRDRELIDYSRFGTVAQLAVPTNDHYLPMLYVLGLREPNEPVRYLYEGFQFAGISMRCFQIG